MDYRSNKGGGSKVSFERAIIDGYAIDGGLYVPEYLPKINLEQLTAWKTLSYKELAFQIISLFIKKSIISSDELKELLDQSYDTFEKEEVIPLYPLKSRSQTYIMELFYGPTLSFKDVGMSFLVNLVNFFLERKNKRLSIIVATTGDTGPAAAHFIAGKSHIDGWILYPKGLITSEQERQMTTLPHTNIHSVGVNNCPEGGDDLDVVIAQLYADQKFKNKHKLSSVNSLNWGRIMVQMVHYFYGYFQVASKIGDPVSFSVPSGGFGNLCAGGLARRMGLPIKHLLIANNQNACLHRIFDKGIFSKQPIIETLSSAIDILVPINFWRYLYFCIEGNTQKIKKWSDTFEKTGEVNFDNTTQKQYQEGFLSKSVDDPKIIVTMQQILDNEHYLLDPHAAVSLVASDLMKDQLGNQPLICLATAHPAKFPRTIELLSHTNKVYGQTKHISIERAKKKCQRNYTCDHSYLYEALTNAMEVNWERKHKLHK